MAQLPILVVEDDPFLRMVGIVLDPSTSAERRAAFADFFAHEEGDFEGYCARVRARVGKLFPCQVLLVGTVDEMHAKLAGARGLIVESLPVGQAELSAAGNDLVAVQKYGVMPRNIDAAACAQRGIKVLTFRRRANIACAEHAITLMLTLAKKMHRLAGRISPEQLAAEGYAYKPFDRRHTPNSNWGRISGVRILYGSTLGIIGMGEIGREIALRAAAFGMRIFYYQRKPLPTAVERDLEINYVPLEQLLATSDWIVTQLPSGPSTRHLIDRSRFAQMKPGARLVNIAWPEIVDRAALIEALRSGHLGGFALDPQYAAPGRSDDELLNFKNVVLSPHIAAQPRFNALDDISDLLADLAGIIAP
ncbi:MAG TPA: NAD(P)-dependent oxidoreductase [Xanthobacteraceae bacterium]|jgi:phosphoglycerate dehydrogenase-like enzyme|nr:NAD(P)-dependent oxidoreductase [Xanthobacteraceae bacterium]